MAGFERYGFRKVDIPYISETAGWNVAAGEGGTSDDTSIGIINIMEIEVSRSADAIMSPVEEGYKVFDNKVIQPLTAKVKIIIKQRNWEKAWELILNMYNNRTYEFYDIETRGEILSNMMLTNVSRAEIVEKNDALELELGFVQVIYANETDVMIPSDPQNSNTKDTGQKSIILDILDEYAKHSTPMTSMGYGFLW